MKKSWKELSMSERAEYIKDSVMNGVYNLEDIRKNYGKSTQPTVEIKSKGGKLFDTGGPQNTEGGYYTVSPEVADEMYLSGTQAWNDIPEITITPDGGQAINPVPEASYYRHTENGSVPVITNTDDWQKYWGRKGADYVNNAMDRSKALPMTLMSFPAFAAAGGAGAIAYGLTDAAVRLKNKQYGNWKDNLALGIDLLPIGTFGALKGGNAIYNTGKAIYDNGTLWDRYTTIGGRFGNWGDTWPEKIWGTMARRFGLPDRAKVPEFMRKLNNEDISYLVRDGNVNLTGHRNLGGNSHTNFSWDRPVVSHGRGDWNRGDLFIVSGEDVLKQTPTQNLISIEPSDAFVNGNEMLFNPQRVTLVSGNVERLK